MKQVQRHPEIAVDFKPFSTSMISDALDTLGIGGGCLGIKPVVSGVKMVGTAYTVHYIPVGAVKGTVGDYIDDLLPGEVVVLDNGGRIDCTVWGDILTVAAKVKGVAGTVIDGVCRDVPTILQEGYPVYSRGSFMMTGKDRVMVDAYQTAVCIGRVQVIPGDILVGDDSGVVVIPQELSKQVLQKANEILEAEEAIVDSVRLGLSLKEARIKFGYHTLQRKKN
jgi:4-hydroxy-4-methyl-2-oxoglutarate aldolase